MTYILRQGLYCFKVLDCIALLDEPFPVQVIDQPILLTCNHAVEQILKIK